LERGLRDLRERVPCESQGLSDLADGRWLEAEQRFTSVLTSAEVDPDRERRRTTAIVGIAHARIVGRLDARAAFPMLQAVLHDGDPEDERLAARTHVVAALLYGTPDAAVYDRERRAMHVAAARALLAAYPDPELSAMCAIAELFGTALVGDPQAFVETERACRAELALARSPIARCLVAELEAVSALAAGELDREAQHFVRALQAARSIGFAACEARVLSRLAHRALEEGALARSIELVAETYAALAAAGAATSWVHLAVSETRRRAVAGERSGHQLFAHAAAGVRSLASRLPPMPDASEGAPSSGAQARHGLDEEIARLAPSRATVLLVGGAASVQAMVARALHDRSARAQGQFVTVDCAELDAEALENRLFGGPSYQLDARGAIHEAERGTLYVASIQALPPALQPRVLGYLDGVKRARVVTSSAVDLLDLVDDGRFRKDLGERLELVRVVLAPVR